MLAAQPGLAQAPLSTAGPLGALQPGPFSIRLTPTSLGIENLQVPNPFGFRGGALARVSRATVRFDCSKLAGWRLRLEEVSVELAEFTLVKNELGHMNIDAFKWVPLPGVFIGDDGRNCAAEPLAKPFVPGEEEGLVPPQRAAQRASKLVSPEFGLHP